MLKKSIHSIKELLLAKDPMTADIGMGGEKLTAQIRLALIFAVTILPLKSIFLQPEKIENWVGVMVSGAAFICSFIFVKLASRPKPPHSLGWVTTQFDVFMVTLGTIGFIVAGQPIIASNNYVHFSVYLLALGATALRANPMISLVAGASAIMQHYVIVTIAYHQTRGVVDTDYGVFDWDTQVGRGILLFLGTILSTAFVLRNRTYWRSSIRDKLTGLHNRRFFDEFLDYRVADNKRQKRSFTLVFIDLDYFKDINDRFGHLRGDQVLEKTGYLIKDFFRNSDLASRHGGEEFTLILPDADLKGIIARLKHFQELLKGVDRDVILTASIGLAVYPEDGYNAEELLAKADERMYQAKENGRNQIVSH